MIGTPGKPPHICENPTAKNLRVFKINPVTDPRWQAFVTEHPEGSIYHHPAWISVVENEYGQVAEHLACEDGDGQLVAILPMLRTRGLPFKLGGQQAATRLASLPRTPLAGPLSIDSRATVAVLQEAVHRASQKPGTVLQIKTQGTQLEGLVGGVVCRPWRLSYVLHLPRQLEGPFRISDSQERAKISRALKKASKLGVVVRPAEIEADLRSWYMTYLESMRRSAVPPRPYRFFAELWKNLRPTGMMQLLVSEIAEASGKKIIAGAVFLMFGRTVSYAYGGMLRRYGSLRGSDAIQWQAINDACQKGFRFFDFGEVPEGHAKLARFKSKWGAQPTRLYRYFTPAPPAPTRGKVDSNYDLRSLPQVVWRYLPLKMTEWLGDIIYSRL